MTLTCHDQVTALPPHATVLASSPTAPFEMWSLGDGILAVQGHPEFSAQLVLDKIYPAMVERGCAACSPTTIESMPKHCDPKDGRPSRCAQAAVHSMLRPVKVTAKSPVPLV